MSAVAVAIGGSALLGAGVGIYGSKQNAKAIDQAATQPRWTDYSGINTTPQGGYHTGYTYIDPSIRALREQQLANLPGYRSALTGASTQYQNQLGDLQSQLASNQSPFMQARMNPLLQQQAQGRANLASNFARRGIFGSLSANAMGQYDESTGRGIADQGALVANENLQAQRQLGQDQYSGARQAVTDFQSLDAQQAAIANQNLQQELSALGLSQANIQGLLGAAQLGMENRAQAYNAVGQSIAGGGSALLGLAAQRSQPVVDPWANYGGSGSVSGVPYGGLPEQPPAYGQTTYGFSGTI